MPLFPKLRSHHSAERLRKLIKLWLQTSCSTLERKNGWHLAVRRIFFLCLAWLSVGTGLVGIFLPVLPTTPFLLVAVWAFMRSSPRAERWLREHEVLGPYISDWTEHQVVPVKAKILAVTMMSASLTWLVFFTDAPRPVVAGVGICLAVVACWLVTRPSRPGP